MHTRHKRTIRLAAVLSFLLAAAILAAPASQRSNAQDAAGADNCADLIQTLRVALSDEGCGVVNDNWVCYGFDVATALPASVEFDEPGDQQPVTVLSQVSTVPPRGVVIMRLLPQGSEDPLTVAVFGDTDTNFPDEGRLGFVVNDPELLCESTPAGMVVRTASGERGRIIINGVEIELASTAFITMENPTSMTVANLQGEVTVVVGGVSITLKPGQQVRIVRVGTAQASVEGPPTDSPFSESQLLQRLTIDILVGPEEVPVADTCVGLYAPPPCPQLPVTDPPKPKEEEPEEVCVKCSPFGAP